jgi:hypothetical protein
MNFPKNMKLFGTVCSGLLINSLIIPQAVLAQETTSKLNPCPGLLCEEPSVPTTPSPYQVCLGVGGEAPAPSVLNPNPGIFSERPYNRSQGGFRSGNDPQTVPTLPPSNRLQAPASEQRQDPSAILALSDGRANIKLINNSGAKVTYQVIGDTAPRKLQGKSGVNLRGLSTPVTVTFQREDGGFLMVIPKPAQEKGTLEVILQETSDFNQDRSAMNIQSNGSVFLN